MAYAFKLPESQDYTVIDADTGAIEGHIRIKPSGVLWKGKSGQTWYRLSIKEFGELAKEHGVKQKM
ncbi:MAG TPA: hypothetical protein PL193_05305 [Xanthobacteraceae bacterium]|nr:hypothetical protein [Xanthobacteraceae bacterium]